MYPKLNGKNSIEKKEWKSAGEMFSVGKLICSGLKPAYGCLRLARVGILALALAQG
jgi:hypothetical protein